VNPDGPVVHEAVDPHPALRTSFAAVIAVPVTEFAPTSVPPVIEIVPLVVVQGVIAPEQGT
jgi:hypothetical protein